MQSNSLQQQNDSASSRSPQAYLVGQTLLERYFIYLLPVVAYSTTGEVALGGLALALEWATVVLFIPYAGRLVDRSNPRVMYACTNVFRAIVAVVAAVLLSSGAHSAAILILGTLLGPANIVAYLGFERYASSLPTQDGSRAYSKFQSTQYICLAASPFAGDALLTLVGPAMAIVVGGAGYALMALTRGIPPGQARLGGTRSRRPSVLLVLKDRPKRGIAMLFFGTNLAMSGLGVALPALSGGNTTAVAIVCAAAAAISAIFTVGMHLAPGKQRKLVAAGKIAGFVSCCLCGIGAIATSIPIVGLAACALSLGSMVAFGVWIRQKRNLVLEDSRGSAAHVASFMMISNLAPMFSGAFLAVVGGRIPANTSLLYMVLAALILYVVGLWYIRNLKDPNE